MNLVIAELEQEGSVQAVQLPGRQSVEAEVGLGFAVSLSLFLGVAPFLMKEEIASIVSLPLSRKT